MEKSAPFDPLVYKLGAKFGESCVTHPMRGETYQPGEKWTSVRVLGQGGHGTVYLEKAEAPLQLRAVKRVPRGLVSEFRFTRELEALVAVRDHEDLFVKFIGWYESTDHLFCAMEYVGCGDLGQYIKKSGLQVAWDAKRITRQILEGLVVLHGKHICHRDLKPQNILIASLTPIQIKLCDFGVSKSTIGTGLHTRYGTQGYIAPEMLGLLPPGLRSRQGYTNAVDIWGLGCVLYEILTLEIPFRDTSVYTDGSAYTDISGMVATTSIVLVDTYLMSEFCKGNVGLPTEHLENLRVEKAAINFLRRLLVANPMSRPSAVDALGDKWVCPDSMRYRFLQRQHVGTSKL